MAEEDCFIDTPVEPTISIPKASLINMEVISPRNHRKTSFKSLSILKLIGEGKFPVFMAESLDLHKYALKLFPCNIVQSQKCYQNEILFAPLFHPNIIKLLYFEQDKEIICKGKTSTASFIVFEYAPYGDFFDFVLTYKSVLNEKLVRSYFRQFIKGLEYLHKRGIAHLDLKPENLLIGDKFNLKIADFDLSCYTPHAKIQTKGTECYRAPELSSGNCCNGFAADVYSAGTILFALKSGGVIPHTENTPYKGIDFFGLLNNDSSSFWEKHCEIQKKEMSEFSHDFKDLVMGMLKSDPEERWTLKQVQESKWFNGPVYTEKELHDNMKRLLHA